MKVNKETYTELIRQDIKALDDFFIDGLEADHIKQTLKYSIELVYGEPKQEEYKEYEFCDDIKCTQYEIKKRRPEYKMSCKREIFGCNKTAKEFHEWLKENNYKIIKQGE